MTSGTELILMAGTLFLVKNMFFIRNKQLRAHRVKLCRAVSEDLCRKVVTNARVRLQEVVKQTVIILNMFFIRNNFPTYED